MTVESDRAKVVAINLRAAVAAHADARHDAAIAACERALAAAPENPLALALAGAVALASGQMERAANWLRHATRQRPNDPEALSNLGKALLARCEWQGAEECLRRAAALRPNHAATAFNLGVALKARGDAAGAERAYRAAAAADPSLTAALVNLAGLRREAGDAAGAAALYERALSVDPGDPRARHMLAALRGDTAAPPPEGWIVGLFDDFADSFDAKLTGPLAYAVPDAFADLLDRREGDRRGRFCALDLGCGTGLCGAAIRPFAARLAGVDLSERMLEKARQRGCYDRLLVGDIRDGLAACDPETDLIVAGDVFTYVGALEEIAATIGRLLPKRGVLLSNVEEASSGEGDGVALRISGRYAHAADYLDRIFGAVGLVPVDRIRRPMRRDAKGPIGGLMDLWRRV